MGLSPQFYKQQRHEPDNHTGPVDFSVASRAERNHKVEDRLPRHPVVNDDLALVTAGRITDAATIAVTFQHPLPQATKIFLILPLERIADSTHPLRKDLRSPAPAMHCVLFRSPHCITRSALP